MNRLAGLFKKPDTRMKAVVVMLAVLALAGLCFIVQENKNNREFYLQTYRQMQQSYTEQLGNQLEELVASGKDETEIITWFSEKAEVSANSWMFWIRGDEVVYAKDRQTTDSLREARKKDTFLADLDGQEGIVTTVTVQTGQANIIGTITAESYALSRAKLQQHEIYLYLFSGIFVMLAVMAVIGLTGKLNVTENALLETEGKMKKQNIKLERSGEQKMIGQPDSHPEAEYEGHDFYDSELIQMFLKKSGDEALMPMQILFADIVMESRYYSRQEIFGALEHLRRFLGKTHVLGEIKKGSFVVLMYRTTYEEAVRIMEQCEESLSQSGGDVPIQMEVSVAEVTEGRRAADVYEERVKGGAVHE